MSGHHPFVPLPVSLTFHWLHSLSDGLCRVTPVTFGPQFSPLSSCIGQTSPVINISNPSTRTESPWSVLCTHSFSPSLRELGGRALDCVVPENSGGGESHRSTETHGLKMRERYFPKDKQSHSDRKTPEEMLARPSWVFWGFWVCHQPQSHCLGLLCK